MTPEVILSIVSASIAGLSFLFSIIITKISIGSHKKENTHKILNELHEYWLNEKTYDYKVYFTKLYKLKSKKDIQNNYIKTITGPAQKNNTYNTERDLISKKRNYLITYFRRIFCYLKNKTINKDDKTILKALITKQDFELLFDILVPMEMVQGYIIENSFNKLFEEKEKLLTNENEISYTIDMFAYFRKICDKLYPK